MQRVGHWHGQYDLDRKISKAESNRIAYELAGSPVLGDFLRAADNRRYLQDYMSFYGLGWDDIKYPTKVPGAGSMFAASSGAMSFLSKNLVKSFYH